MVETEKQVKKSDTKSHILYDSVYMKCPEQANPQRQKADQWLPGSGEWGGKGGGVTANGYQVIWEVIKNVLKLVVIVEQLCEYIKTLKTLELYTLNG